MGRYRNITILGAVVILQILGLAIQIKRQDDDHGDSTRLIRVWTVSAVTPFEKLFVRAQGGASNIWRNYFYLRGVRQQNRGLQQQIQDMQIKEARLQQDAEQAHRLQLLLGFKETYIAKTVAAQVIGSSGSEQSRLVYIDKGSDDGVKRDMAVITASGVVGKVVNAVNGSTSQVLLINDQNSGVGIILEQSRLQGVLKGKASGELVLEQIMSEEDVKVGDRVLTSGGDQIFPKGLPVGTVSRVIRGSEFLQVVVQPLAALNHLEEVLVITQKEDHEPASLAGNPVRAADILAERLPSVPDAPASEGMKQAVGEASATKPAGIPKAPPKAAVGTSPAENGVAVTARKTQATPAATQNTVPAASQPSSVSSGPTTPASGSAASAALPKPAQQTPANTENPDSTQPANGAPPQ